MDSKQPVKNVDVAIVGGGPAGLSAATLLARMKRSVVLFDAGNQRNIRSHGMHNFPTRDGMLPPDFLRLTRDEAAGYGVTLLDRLVTAVEKKSDYCFAVTDSAGNRLEARRVLFATGVEDIVPEVPGMQELWGCAVHHCPYCDGWECRDDIVGLYSSKVNGYGMALALHHLADRIVLFTDGGIKPRGPQVAELKRRGIAIEAAKLDRLVYEGEKMRGVALADGRTVACNKMFVNNGQRTHHLLLNTLGCRLTNKNAAVCNRKQETSIPGIYVAGDASIGTHFVIVAAAEGAKAGVSMHEDMLDWDNRRALALKNV